MKINYERLARFNELELCLMNQYPKGYYNRWLGMAMLFIKIIIKEEKQNSGGRK